MSKLPSHVVSLVFYCHKCKSSNIVLNPQESVDWSASQTVEDTGSKGKFTMTVNCPSCGKDVDVELKKWDTTSD